MSVQLRKWSSLLGLLALLLMVPLFAQTHVTPVESASADRLVSAQTAPKAIPVAQQPLEPGGFIQANGSQLTRLGQPVQLKGVNYYPQGRPWAEMWKAWDGPQIARELQLGRDQLGINAIRVLLPYKIPRENAVTRLTELAQIAGNLDMRLIVTLFDFEDNFPSPGSADEHRHIRYLEGLLPNFAGDDRIMAWDLHNEPDNYPTWQEGEVDRVLVWLSRMAVQVKQLAPNHLVTVGLGHVHNLWLPGPDGQRVVDYSDFISMHTYNAADAERQIYELRTYTDKPIVLGEFGWPSGPGCELRDYNESTQEWVYRTMLQAAEVQGAAGVIAWTLRDYHSGPTIRWDTREEHYGLFRFDDSLKPAAEAFIAYAAPPLPSAVQTNMELTRSGLNTPGGSFAPRQVEGTNYYVKGWFRIAWERLGGRGTFGLPLGEAFVRPSDQRVVQYFEAAVLEYRPENGGGADWDEKSKLARALRLIRPVDIGHAYTMGRAFPQHEEIPHDARRFAETGYTIHGEFREFYEGAYGEWRLGAPVSEELFEEINDVTIRVQYFQRGRLEQDPTTGEFRFGQLGSWAYALHCLPQP